MALNIIRDPDLTSQFSTALGTGLQQLLAHRANQMLQQKTASGLEALGLNQQESKAIAQLPEQFQNQVLLAYLQRGGAGAQPSTTSAESMPQATQEGLAQSGFPSVESQARPTIAQTLAKPTLKEQRQLQLAEKKLEQGERKIAQQEKASAFKATAADRKAIIERAKAARQDLEDLNRLEELEKEGKLDTPGYIEFLKRSGLEIPALMNEGSEEYNKVAQTFIRNAKEYLGSRISNFELEQFLKTIPSLTQSPEGRKRIIANLKKVRSSAVAYNEALQEVMKEHKGIPPYDLNELVEEKISKKLDKISEKFREDLAKPVPEGQNKFITGLQAAAGTVAGRLPRAAAGGALGAAYGASRGGPYGGLIGGTLGGLAGLSGLSVKDFI